jgi:hypothetical protein
MSTESQCIPAIIVEGTPAQVDDYLIAELWRADGPHPSLPEVVAWRHCLLGRGEDFSSHEAACYYWLCEQLAGCPPWAYPR